MDLIGYLTTYFLTNIINKPLNVFLLFTAVTTIISFIFIHLGEWIYKKFSKKNNFTLYLTTLITFTIYLVLKGIYNSLKGINFSFNFLTWIIESLFIYLVIRIVKAIDLKWINEYNLPKNLQKLIWALIGSAIAWALIIIAFYTNYRIW